MFFESVSVYTILIGISVVNAKLFLPVSNNDDFLQSFANSTSDTCKKDITLLIASLNNNTLWAYRMWDATAKYPTGLTEGNVYQFGNFDECLSIDRPFTAQYCLARIEYTIVQNTPIKDPFSLEYDPYESVYKKLYHTGDPNKIHRDQVHWGLCVPASCNAHDVQSALQAYLDKQLDANIKEYHVKLVQADCQMKQSKDALNIIFDTIFAKIIALCMTAVTICTGIDLRYSSDNDDKNVKKAKWMKLLLCFSAKQNYKDLNIPETLPALHGAKVLISCYLIFVHHVLHMLSGPVYNHEPIELLNRTYLGSIVFTGTLVMEIYLFISGALITYIYRLQSEKGNINSFIMIIARYIRLMPIFALVTLFYTTVMYNIGSGPIWNRVIGAETNRCQKNWWLNLLLLNNYIDRTNMCVIQGWYLAVDFHIFILSMPLYTLFFKESKFRSKIFFPVLVLSVFIQLFIFIYNNSDPFAFYFSGEGRTLLEMNFFQQLYAPSHTRATTYIIGMAFGFVYYNFRNCRFNLSTLKSVLLLVSCVMVILKCTFGTAVFYDPYTAYSRTEAVLFFILYRLGFGISIGLLTLIIGYGTLFPYVTEFLSWSPFVPLSKLSFTANMIHMPLQLINLGRLRAPQTLSLFSVLTGLLSDIVLTVVIAFVLFMCFENPIYKLTKQLIGLYISSRIREKKL